MGDEIVGNDETLYRRVSFGRNLYQIVDGRLRFSSTAFNDAAGSKPSVDRAVLRTGPEETKLLNTDGVTSLVTSAVRGIAVENLTPNGKSLILSSSYQIDVLARPIVAGGTERENLAHAQIESEPEFLTKSRFNRLKEALAQLATARGWLIEPIAPL